MNNKTWLIAGIVALILVGSIIVTGTVVKLTGPNAVIKQNKIAAPTLTEEAAKDIANNIVPGDVQEVELVRKNGQLVYVVEIENVQGEYEVTIDPTTGLATKVEQETEVGRKELSLVTLQVSKSQAITIARNRVPGEVKEVGIEKINGNYVYEVEIERNGDEFEVIVDGMSGEILDIEQEQESSSARSFANSGEGISEEEAIEIAEDRVGSRFRLEEVETGRFKGKNVWEVEFEDGNEEAEVIIDMQTGDILDVEFEEDD